MFTFVTSVKVHARIVRMATILSSTTVGQLISLKNEKLLLIQIHRVKRRQATLHYPEGLNTVIL